MRVPMLPEKQTKTNIGVGTGILLQLVGFYLAQTGDTAAIFWKLLILVSMPVFIWGCMNYAEGKGHSKWAGLVALASLIGLIVLILLPDHNHQGSVAPSQRRKYVGVISIVAGFGLAVLGLWLDRLGIDDIRLQHRLMPWPVVCMFLGFCLVAVPLVFMIRIGRR
jgi:drug/metabolite transporter (DMT)-like permease